VSFFAKSDEKSTISAELPLKFKHNAPKSIQSPSEFIFERSQFLTCNVILNRSIYIPHF